MVLKFLQAELKSKLTYLASIKSKKDYIFKFKNSTLLYLAFTYGLNPLSSYHSSKFIYAAKSAPSIQCKEVFVV